MNLNNSSFLFSSNKVLEMPDIVAYKTRKLKGNEYPEEERKPTH